MLTTKCGKTHNAKGNPFTEQSIKQHEEDCVKCGGTRKYGKVKASAYEDEFDIDPLGIVDDDMPDGAYWAMHSEFYGWP